MKLDSEALETRLRVWEAMAGFGAKLNESEIEFLQEDGFGEGEVRGVGCLGWLWCEWLLQAPPSEIINKIQIFVDYGMEMQTLSTCFHKRPRHDLFLLHCAIFASREDQLHRLADRVIDSSGSSEVRPKDDGELYASAWCGLLKYWIKGDILRAQEESDLIWAAYRDPAVCATSRQLVDPWLKKNWRAFRNAQAKDFAKKWELANKNRAIQLTEDGEQRVNLGALKSIGQTGAWAHCGLAALAYRGGVSVVTDDLWFPPHALTCLNEFKRGS